jgi:mRNA-degrading endonuclease RelE of RelBE toxin-antitoxin system
MNSKTTRHFRQMLAKLPSDVRRQAREAYRLFRQNPNHPSLRFKKVHNSEPIYSARINIDYRAVGVLDGNEIVWFWIGPHGEYDKLLDRL